MTSRLPSKSTAFLAIIIATVLWGTTYPVVKIGISVLTPPLPPLGYLFLRFSIAIIVIIPLFPFLTSIGSLKSLFTDKYIILLGIVNGGSYIFQFIGQSGTTSGMATLMVNTYLISTPLLTSYYLKTPLTKNLKISILIGAIGVLLSAIAVIITDIPTEDIFLFLISTLIILLSGLVWGGYAIVSSEFYLKSKNKETTNPIMVFAISNFYSVLLIGISMVFTNQIPNINNFSIEAWSSVLYLALGCTLVAYVLYIYANKIIPPTTVNVILLLNIIIGIILSAIVLGDTISLLMIIGSIFIIVAIYLAGREVSHDSEIK